MQKHHEPKANFNVICNLKQSSGSSARNAVKTYKILLNPSRNSGTGFGECLIFRKIDLAIRAKGSKPTGLEVDSFAFYLFEIF